MNDDYQGLVCPECGGRDSSIYDSRPKGYRGLSGKWRRRRCCGCGASFSTIEVTGSELDTLAVDKELADTLRQLVEESYSRGQRNAA